jgi:hypothetical protein
MDDYIIPVDIEYNREYLYECCLDIKHWPLYSNDRGKTLFSEHKDIVFPLNVEAIKIKNKLLYTSTYSFSYVPPGHETGWHSDFTRGATLILPLDPNPHLIKFKVNDTEVDYYYSTPVITNADTIHNGVNYTDQPRFNLLFHIDQPFADIKQIIANDQFVTKWKQEYNIGQCYKNDMVKTFFNTHEDLDTAAIIITDDDTIADHYSFNKFIIYIGDHLDYTSIIIKDTAKDKDLVNAIKYILDSTCYIKKVEIGK